MIRLLIITSKRRLVCNIYRTHKVDYSGRISSVFFMLEWIWEQSYNSKQLFQVSQLKLVLNVTVLEKTEYTERYRDVGNYWWVCVSVCLWWVINPGCWGHLDGVRQAWKRLLWTHNTGVRGQLYWTLKLPQQVKLSSWNVLLRSQWRKGWSRFYERKQK